VSLTGSIILFSAVAIASWLAGFPLRRGLIRAGVLDVPKAYSSHSQPVPRGGGLLVIVTFFCWFFIADHHSLPAVGWAAAGVAAVAAISFRDDVRPQSRRLRFAIYTLAAATFVLALRGDPAFLEWGPFWLCAPWLWLWVAGYANAFNFIDGIDGLAGTQATIALQFGAAFCALSDEKSAATSLISLQIVLAGSMAGFLGHNLPRARLFLGDVGSIGAGFLLATITVMASLTLGWKIALAMGSLHLGPVLDTGITLLRRLIQGKAIYDRHREFFFHRAIRSGSSHITVTLTEAAIQIAGATLVFAALVFGKSDGALFGAIAVTALLWFTFFGWCERRYRRLAQ
jgi:UDP-N-acetylmuramyl pentapeptide phosphotransferase/UDP-N-acetylglucosamine-1-phosphate transferase